GTLQRALLPEVAPEVPGLAVATRYFPGGAGLQVGGDWYDVFGLPGRRLGVAVGDVVGHGVGAAAVMGQRRSPAAPAGAGRGRGPLRGPRGRPTAGGTGRVAPGASRGRPGRRSSPRLVLDCHPRR